MNRSLHLVWHRTELRTHDHPALVDAAKRAQSDGGAVVPIVIIDPKIFGRPDLTPRRQAHFLENVRALRDAYRELGADLVVRKGDPPEVLAQIVDEWKSVKTVSFIRNYTPYAKERDASSTKALEERGVETFNFGGQYTHEPGEVQTDSGTRYGVFGAYRRKWASLDKPEILDKPESLQALPSTIKIGEIRRVEPGIVLPEAGEATAQGRLEWFLKNGESFYEKTRDEPGLEESTSKLSYYFNIGVLSPRLAFHRARTEKWKAELTWWDFYADVLDRAPESAKESFKSDWREFPWRDGKGESKSDLQRWQAGETGFPLVDAGMRELNQTGFMHNRVRMVVASFLTKHLLIDWRVGEEIFRGLLLCGDRSQNVGNWQWVAGCGVDPTPYFRVFNPTAQGEKFDPKGDYVKRWIPELRDVKADSIYEPWKLKTPPKNHPAPMLELGFGRDRFLETAKAFLKREKAVESGD